VLENLNLKAFAEHLQTTFQTQMEDGRAVELLMVSAKDSGTTDRQEQFSIVFRGPLDVFLDQRTYELKHPQMGELALLLVPIKRDQEGFYYEASFNRIL
jgi:hypothetical protein